MWRGTKPLLAEAGFVPIAVAWEPKPGMGVEGAALEVLLPTIRRELVAAGFSATTSYHAVGHSSGGLPLRWLLQEGGEEVGAQIRSLTLVSTPNHGARTGLARIACASFRQPWRALACDLIPGSEPLTTLGHAAPADGPPTLAIGVETLPNLLIAPPFDADGDGVAHSHDNAVMAESPYLEGATFRIWSGRRLSHFSVSCSSTVNGWILAFLQGKDVPEQGPDSQPGEDLCRDHESSAEH